MKVIRVFAVLSVCSILSVLSSCRQHDNDAGMLPASNYRVIDVQNGGTITGTVKVEGGVPAIPKLEINHDNDACGTEHSSPRLACGKNGELKYAVVYLREIHEGAANMLPEHQPLITQKGCAYEPHISVVPVGTTIAVKNEDRNVLHNVHMLMGDTTIWNQAQPMFEQVNTHRFRRPGVMSLQCDAGHIWMSGYVWVTEHPYYAVTNDSGQFALQHVPPGTYKLVCWHEGWNAMPRRDQNNQLTGYSYDAPYELQQGVTVSAGMTSTAAFAVVPHTPAMR